MAKRQVILVIIDGWGIGPKNDANPIHIQGTPNIDYIKTTFPIGALQASGISVGLPWNEEGNSEVGHLTIGAGKVLYQNFPRITLSIKDGSFHKNQVFLDAFAHTKKNKSVLHLAGLLTEGNVHASFDHLVELIKLAKKKGVSDISLHLFSDGRDSRPKSFLELIKKLSDAAGDGKIGSIAGRFYALDRDKRWERTRETYEAMIGNKPATESIENIAKKVYEQGYNDEYVVPSTMNKDLRIKDNDALIFCDFREDRARQLASAFILEDFSEFPVQKFQNLYIATMTRYAKNLTGVPIAYPKETVDNPLAKVLSDNKKTQLHVAETEKYAHVTYFLNGYKEKPFPNEYRVLIPSQKVVSYAQKPEMQAAEITSRVLQAVQEQGFDFIIVNYANGDMVAHTGDYEASKAAVKVVDDNIGALVRGALEYNSTLLITSDHGNVEIMLNPKTGETTTTHDTSPVPVYLVGNDFVKTKSKAEEEMMEKENIGILSDIAPTILELMDIPKPKEMTGESFLGLLREK